MGLLHTTQILVYKETGTLVPVFTGDKYVMTWYFEDSPVEELPEDCVGFIYMIHNLKTGRRYIGKKLAQFSKTTYRMVKLKNGTKKRKRIRSKVDSDWRDYWSSSDELKADVAAHGTENFRREILRYCASKNQLSYYEAKYQFMHDVLLHEDQWYNGWISVKVRRFRE
jgi:hypothetical protein